jgi:hypothetical protein
VVVVNVGTVTVASFGLRVSAILPQETGIMITVAHVTMVVAEGTNSDATIEGVREKGIGFLSLDLRLYISGRGVLEKGF